APTSAAKDLLQLEQLLTPEIKLATVIGRYYAMDRDHRWERIKKAYDLFVHGIGNPGVNVVESITQSYKDGITDEFIAPMVVDSNGLIEPGDVVISFNFRTDRPREIAEVLTQKAIPECGMEPLSLHYVTMTNYDDSFSNMHVIFQKDNLVATLGEVVANHKKTQVRIAETEKYPHVTYFFSGGREQVFEGESRILIESPKVATYDLQPEMSAIELTERALEKMHFPQCLL
ncbi:MAG: 2,3-bisphosphoglycerate-independent phosphoglycerate mutase, partial [Chitinophagia bacterium]|nr:2,3-bisphosphoglycerate-independent phosphoglycerate mutase [Chitinophagia bacterium]